MAEAPPRRVVLHYHIFKNAGTSVDRALRESFGERWVKFDRSDPGAKISPAEMDAFLEEHPEVLAVSSHQCVPPVPNGSARVLPLIFFRHPVARAYSAYAFEWGRQKGVEKPASSFEEYLVESLAKRRASAIEDFQVRHVANRGHQGRRPAAALTNAQLLRNACAFVDSLDFFGLVERFEESMVRANLYLKPHFPEFLGRIYRENASENVPADLEQYVEHALSLLSPDVRADFLARNALDSEFYAYVTERFQHMGLRAKPRKQGPSQEPR
jgi:hypothetical protein